MGSVVLDNRSDGLTAAEIVEEMSSASAPKRRFQRQKRDFGTVPRTGFEPVLPAGEAGVLDH